LKEKAQLHRTTFLETTKQPYFRPEIGKNDQFLDTYLSKF